MMPARLIITLIVISGFAISCGNKDNNSSGVSTPQTNATPTPAPVPTATPIPGNTFFKVREGTWGGEHLRMVVGPNSSTLDYDCAHGTIDEPLLFDSTGSFSAEGTHTFEHGGPIPNPTPAADTHPAHYSGLTDNQQMAITVKLKDTGEVIGTYNLTYGSNGHVVKCL